MKEYGGYIELDTYRGAEYYPKLPAFNSGRAALRFLIRYRRIQKLLLPGFCCSTVREACEAEGIPWEFYSIDSNFHPILKQPLQDQEWLYVVNFYGTLTDQAIKELAVCYPRMIADYTHAFFQKPLEELDTLYSCRKFFGVADGAYLSVGTRRESPSSDDHTSRQPPDSGMQDGWEALYQTLPLDVSFERMHFLLGRFEGKASDFYQEYARNNEIFTAEPVKRMSALTRNLLRGIDYDFTRQQRTENFRYLHARLKTLNRLNLAPIPGAYAYPFWYQARPDAGAGLRAELIRRKIYVPTLWPEVLEQYPADSLEYQMAENILPLPIDQRYTREDMDQILETLFRLLESHESNV